MMRRRNGTETLPGRTIWSFFPWFITAGMSVVVAVNVGMAYTALHTFPGEAGSDGFDLSNHYDQVLARVAREAALGWTARVELDAARHPVVVLRDRSGGELSGVSVAAKIERPLGDPRTTNEQFSEVSPGRYVGLTSLDEPGQWDVEFTARGDGREFIATRRVIAR
jgi:nitrogen fixation protein FixH